MLIRVNVPDERAAQEPERGVPLEEFVEQLLAEQVGTRSAQAVPPRTSEQIRA